jgi:hypothetical protein
MMATLDCNGINRGKCTNCPGGGRSYPEHFRENATQAKAKGVSIFMIVHIIEPW